MVGDMMEPNSLFAHPASRFLIAEVEGATVRYARLKFGEAPTAVAGQRQMEIVLSMPVNSGLAKGLGRG